MGAEGRALGRIGEHVIAKAVEGAGVRDAEQLAVREGVQAGTGAAERTAAKDLARARRMLDDGSTLEKASRSEILARPGGRAAAEREFDQLTDGLPVRSYPNGSRVATLPDGTEISLRGSSDGRVTIELFTKTPRSQTKYRYGEP